jgi:hypothetical protein
MKLKIVHWICLTAIAISFTTGCAPDYPAVSPKLIDWKRQRFLNHELVDRQNVQFKATTFDSDLSKLNAHYCLSASELGELNEWAREKQRNQ